MTCRPLQSPMLALAALLLTASLAPSRAQEQDMPGTDAPATADDCRALPGGAPEDETAAVPEDLSERLARCDGVLAPPAAGDPEIVAPPPDIGTTPVLPPEAVPEQPPG